MKSIVVIGDIYIYIKGVYCKDIGCWCHFLQS
jgi:hypothetical protein